MTIGIIQARMASTRLPGKIMKDLAGQKLLWHVIDRAMKAKNMDKVVVATTINPEDDAVEDFCKENGFLFYRGSADNVLERYYKAVEKFGGDNIVRLTGDCPLVNPHIIDLCVEAFLKNKCDYISDVLPGDTLPSRNQEVEVVSFSALEKAFLNASENFEREHVTPYIWQNKNQEFIIGPKVAVESKYDHRYRLVVDYPEDFELMEKIYEKFYKPGQIIDIVEVISFLDKNPEWVAINANCKQKSI
jgi:spore coat polysaccharide biosynthesis protein SpsF